MAKAILKPKPFSKLSAAEKRIAIAEDIIKQINADRYSVRQGMWLAVDPVKPASQEDAAKLNAKIIQNVLLGGRQTIVVETPPATCTCCAVGAACASAIRLFNQDSLTGSPGFGYELEDYKQVKSILQKYFPKAQIDLMEAAFEIRTDSHHRDAGEKSLDRAIEFGDGFIEDEDRLKAICNNIIKNKGTFRP